MATLLQQAIDLARAGQRDNAERLLRRVLADQPDNEVAWLWLSGVVRDQAEKRQALQRVLAINPDNELAQRGLGLFGGKPAASEPPQPSMTTSLPSEPTPLSEFSLTDDEADDDPLSFMTEDASLFAEPDEATSEGGGFDFGGDLSFDFTTEADDPADITTGDATHFSFDETETEEPALADMSSFGGFDRSEDDSPFNFDFDATDEPAAADEDSFAFDKQETIQSSGFDFALDDVPDFNFEAESEAGESEAPPSLLKSNVPGVAADDEDVGFDWDSPPAFDFNIDIASLASSAADPWARESEDEVEEMAAGQAALNRLGQFTGPADAEIDLPESDLS
jgi:hypothetical protein